MPEVKAEQALLVTIGGGIFGIAVDYLLSELVRRGIFPEIKVIPGYEEPHLDDVVEMLISLGIAGAGVYRKEPYTAIFGGSALMAQVATEALEAYQFGMYRPTPPPPTGGSTGGTRSAGQQKAYTHTPSPPSRATPTYRGGAPSGQGKYRVVE